jgi:hypothetical protein
MAKFIIPKQVIENKAKLILKSNTTQFLAPKFFKVDESNVSIEQNEYTLAKQDYPKGKFGIPVFDAIQFDKLSYNRPSDGQLLSVSQLFFETALIEVNQSKIIVQTQVQGRNGTVKEYITDGDWEVTITGAMISEHSNVPPELQIRHLNEFKNAPVPISVYSNFLAYFEIFSLVIKDFRVNQIEGTRNAISFTINCISDIPFEIQYKDNNSKFKSTASF